MKGTRLQNKQSMSSARKVCAIACLLTLTACKAKTPPAQTQNAQTGVASWYGVPFNGRPTASGEIYDMEKLTAAHRTLPLGTVVEVNRIDNGQKVQVKINDRGPFVQGRIIDLSHAAAQAISMPGIANVKLVVVSSPPTRGVEQFAVQIGAFSDRASGEQLRNEMQQKYGTAQLVLRPGDQTWRVLVGFEPTEEQANALAQQLSGQPGGAFVVMVDSDQQ
jgi:rare lipoprotein A